MNTTIINDMKSMRFSGIVPKSVCRTIFDGMLTESLLTEVNEVMSENGFSYAFGLNVIENEDFTGFASGNGRIWVSVRYFGNGNPLYTWGILRTN